MSTEHLLTLKNGMFALQSRHVVDIFPKILMDFDQIIEIGTYEGIFTYWLASYSRPDCKIITYDNINYTKPIPLDRINYRTCDIWENVDEIRSLLQQPKRTLFLCDGGEKEREFNTFAPFIKPGDVIMLHDYRDSEEDYVKIKQEIDWFTGTESCYENIKHTVNELGLQPYLYDEFKRVLWGSFTKPNKKGMKIVQITPGMIEIPPKTWGAVEKIIWQYKLRLEEQGHTVDIKYLDEVRVGDYDIVHIHMANLALIAHDRGLPYVFTLHDHHTYVYGKESPLYKENLMAMRYAELAIVPAEYLIEYFEGIPIYLPHGVDLNTFKPKEGVIKKGVLCVGNNGMAGDSTFDRKGFSYAITAASRLNIPVTVLGPRQVNEAFFESQKSLPMGLTNVWYDKTDEELVEEYQKAEFLIHATYVEAGHPPLTILEAMACGTPVIGTFMGNGVIYPACEVERDADQIQAALNYLSVDSVYNRVRQWYLEKVKEYSWTKICERLHQLYKSTQKSKEEEVRVPLEKLTTMISQAQNLYEHVRPIKLDPVSVKNSISYSFIDGAKVEVLGGVKTEYEVKFIDRTNNEVVYTGKIFNNMWCAVSRKWYIPWLIEVRGDTGLESHEFNLEGKRVWVVFDSYALGDTIAWIPYVEEFRKKHNCKVSLACNWHDQFKEVYPDIDFILINDSMPEDTYAKFLINWQPGDTEHNPVDVRTIPLQQVAANVLGVEYKEMRPKLTDV